MYNNYANVYHYIIVFIGFGFGGKWWLVDFQNVLARSSHSAEVTSLQFFLSCSFVSRRFCSRTANLSSGVDVAHAARQVCCPAEKTAGKKNTRGKKYCVTFMQTRDMYLHFTRSNIWANGNN